MTDTAWTWMMYFATHTKDNIALPADSSIALVQRGLAQGDQNNSVRVLLQQATADKSIRRIVGAPSENDIDLGQIDSGDPATLVDFIKWAVTTAPAQHYALVIWSHGSGWEPWQMQQQTSPTLEPVTRGELEQRSADDGSQVFFSTTMRTLLALPTPPTRALAFDDGSGHAIDTVQFGQVLDQTAQLLGRPIDLVAMNACLMSSIEVAYQIRNSVQVYVASEELVPVQSFPYDDILGELKNQPTLDAAALGKLMVERYCAFFSRTDDSKADGTPPPSVTLAALQLPGIEPLAKSVQILASTLQTDMQHELMAIYNAHRAAHPFLFRLYDLASFCQSFLTQPTVTAASIAAAQNVLTALADPAFLLAAQHTSSAYDNTGGVSTYLMPPAPGKTVSPYYALTAYAQATGWGNFLAAYYDAVD